MVERDLSHTAALILQRKPLQDHGPALSRDQGIAVVAEAMHRVRRRSFWRKRLYVGGTVAAVAASAVLWIHAVTDAERRASAAAAVPAGTDSPCLDQVDCRDGKVSVADVALASAEHFAPGSRLETTLGDSRDLTLTSGTRLRIAGGTTLVYEEGRTTHRFSLSRGHTVFSVVKQRAQERFLVNTPDAEIEVHGTVFDVALNEQADNCGHRTAVTVSEGIVEVRAFGERSFVTAGSHWPSGCAGTQLKQATPSGQRSTSPVHQPSSDVESVTPALVRATKQRDTNERDTNDRSESASSPSSLAAQNELFARATLALRRGNYDQAIALYAELDTRYPNSPLAASAAASQLRAAELARKAR